MKKLETQIKAKNFSRSYLFFGNESFLKNLYKEKLKKAMIEETAEAMNFNYYEDKKVSVSSIIDTAETLPFLSEKRLIIVKNSSLFYSGRKEDSEKMAVYLEKVPQTSCILFIEEEVDKRGKLYKAITKYGYPVEFKALSEKELISWITKGFQKNNISIEAKAASYLVYTVGGDMNSLIQEIRKLCDYKGQNGSITIADIDSICIKSFEAKVFDLVAAIGNQKLEKAIEIYSNLLLFKQSPIMILAMIIRQFRLILQCQSFLKENLELSFIAQRLEQRDFIVKQCLNQSKNFSFEKLKQALEDCLETDIQIKTGKMNGELAVELLIVKYSQ